MKGTATMGHYDEQEYAVQIYPVIRKMFKNESISFENWCISEIPVWTDLPLNKDGFITVVLCNDITKQDLNFHIGEYNKLIEVMVIDWNDTKNQYHFKTISEALKSPYSYYEK